MSDQWIRNIVDEAMREREQKDIAHKECCKLAIEQAMAEIVKAYTLASGFLDFLVAKGLVKNVKTDTYPYPMTVNSDRIFVQGNRFTFDYAPIGEMTLRSAIIYLYKMQDNGTPIIDTYAPGSSGIGTDRRAYALTQIGVEAFIRREIYGLETARGSTLS